MSSHFLRRLRQDDEGSSLILIIAAGLLCIAVVIGVMAATSLYIERKRLFTVADGAALAAAEAFSLDEVVFANGAPRVQLSSGAVASETRRYLSLIPVADSSGIGVVSALTRDGRSATVTLQKTWRPPVVSVFFPEGMSLSVTSTARTVLR
jgi:Flp pilus assembly protein TadG